MKNNLLLIQQSVQAHEIHLHYKRPLFKDMITISNSDDIYTVMQRYLNENTQSLDVKECMWLICLNRANKLLSINKLSVGSVFGTTVNIPEIFQIMLLIHGTTFVLVHNHPSGSLTPSEADITITEKIKSFGMMMDIRLLDHLIITTESYYSFADNDLL